jgi:hypothetical protein
MPPHCLCHTYRGDTRLRHIEHSQISRKLAWLSTSCGSRFLALAILLYCIATRQYSYLWHQDCYRARHKALKLEPKLHEHGACSLPQSVA